MASTPVTVIDVPMPLPESFSFDVAGILAAEAAIEQAAYTLAAQKVDAILQIGGPFAILQGADRAEAIEARIAGKTGLPFEMMGLSMLRALMGCTAREVMVCSAYYPEAWNSALVTFVEASGLRVSQRQSFAELGASPAQDAAAMEELFVEIGPDQVISGLSRCAELAPDQPVYLSGVPCPLLAHHERLQRLSRAPLITYLDSYPRLLERAGVPVKSP